MKTISLHENQYKALEFLEKPNIGQGHKKYGGVRLRRTAYLGKTCIAITVDIGFGDAIAGTANMIDYPSLLDMPAANIRAYRSSV